MIFLLKILSQLVLVICGITSLLTEPIVRTDGKTHIKPSGFILLTGILVGALLFVGTEFLQGRQASVAHAEDEARYQATQSNLQQNTDIALATLLKQPMGTLEVRWLASERQQQEIEGGFERLPHYESRNWNKAGVIAEYDGATQSWVVRVLGVLDRVEPWIGHSEMEGFEGISDILRQILLKGLVMHRDGSETRLADATNVRRITIGRNGVITARTAGGQMRFQDLAPGNFQFVADPSYNDKRGYLPEWIMLVSQDPSVVLEQKFDLNWSYPPATTFDEAEQTVFPGPAEPPKSQLLSMDSTFDFQ